jgi:LAO/AO transport system kinase
MARGKTDIGELAEKLAAGDRRALARAITLVESTREDHRSDAENLIAALAGGPKAAIRIGITGAPGVGKSTFIEAFGTFLTGQGHRLAVLAVDPSSSRTGGSILGDKTRMSELSRDPNAFIRPSPSGGSLGGVARRTREAMYLVEAAGFDVVIVETVGVGQSEFAVADMVDMFVLLLSPGGGDELQGIKRGIMELADLVVVNKADGELLPAARHAASDYRAALGLIRPKTPAWQPEVAMVSALRHQGLADIWEAVTRFRAALEGDGGLDIRRSEQARRWMWTEVEEALLAAFKANGRVEAGLKELEGEVLAGRITPSAAAKRLVSAFLGGD